MKNLRKSGLALAMACAFLVTNLTSFATTGNEEKDLITITETSNVKYELNRVPNSHKVMMGIKLLNDEKVRLTIENEDSDEVFSNYYKTTNGFIQLFDFSQLEDGEYTFKVKAGKELVENKVILKDAQPILPPFSAYISDVEDSKVKFSYFAPKDDVYLILRDNNGKTLFEKKVGAGYNSSGIANLSKLDKGSYILEIKNGDQVESKNIEI